MNDEDFKDLADEVNELFEDPTKDEERYEANMELLDLLRDRLTEHPEERFNQALINLGLVRDETDDFYTEPQEVLERVQGRLRELEELDRE